MIMTINLDKLRYALANHCIVSVYAQGVFALLFIMSISLFIVAIEGSIFKFGFIHNSIHFAKFYEFDPKHSIIILTFCILFMSLVSLIMMIIIRSIYLMKKSVFIVMFLILIGNLFMYKTTIELFSSVKIFFGDAIYYSYLAQAALSFVFFIVIMKSSWDYSNISEKSKMMINVKIGLNPLSFSYFSILNIPADYIKSLPKMRRVVSLFLFSISSLAFSIGMFLIFVEEGGVAKTLGVLFQECNEINKSPNHTIDCTKNFANHNMVNLTGIVNKAYGFSSIVISLLLFRLSKRYAITTAIEARENDPRNSILYLRSFNHDTNKLVRARDSYFYRIFSVLHGKEFLDDILVEEGTQYGPVIAIGDPTTLRSPYGPARHFTDDCEDWHEYVSKSIGGAAILLVLVDESEGLTWELEEILRTESVGKCVFIRSPGSPAFADMPCFSGVISWFLGLGCIEDSQRFCELLENNDCMVVMAMHGERLALFTGGQDSDLDYRIAIRASLRIRSKALMEPAAARKEHLFMRFRTSFADSFLAARPSTNKLGNHSST